MENNEVDTRPPWEQSWGDTVEPVEIPVQNESKPTLAPWEMSWGEDLGADLKASPGRFVARQGSFDEVFNRLIGAESKGQHRDASGKLTTSPVGAEGIAQVMPKTGKNPGYGIRPMQDDSEEESLRFGRDYLTAMLDNFGGDWEKAVAAYNAGPGSVQKAVALGGENWVQYLPKRKETIPYMNKILGTNYQIERRKRG